MKNRIRKRAEASGLNVLKKPTAEDEESARDDTTIKGISFAPRCKLTSVSLILRKPICSSNNSYEEPKHNTQEKNIKDQNGETKETDIPLLCSDDSKTIILKQGETETEHRAHNISEVNMNFIK